MIRKIDIKDFGIFKNYNWSQSIGEYFFRKVNVLYGRNYSGKTTLSNIFKYLEDKKNTSKHPQTEAKFLLEGGGEITINGDETSDETYLVKVYNSDFVKANLSWLHNEDGTIKPITVLGKKNIETEAEINKIIEQLGSEELQKGLYSDQITKTKNYKAKHEEIEKYETNIENKLKDKAREIKVSGDLYNPPEKAPNYTITNIKKDIEKARGIIPLTQEEEEKRAKIIREDEKPPINHISTFSIDLKDIIKEVNEILSLKISPTKAITDLLNNNLLQHWVHEGISLHKGKREKCAFCNNIIDDGLWNVLDNHFNKESLEIEGKITALINKIKSIKERLTPLKLKKELFYFDYQGDFEKLNSEFRTQIEEFIKINDELISRLNQRKSDIFKAQPEYKNNTNASDILIQTSIKINTVIDAHNANTETLSKKKNNARDDLRFSLISRFIKDINYDESLKNLSIKKVELKTCDSTRKEIEKKIKELEQQLKTLKAQLLDETAGADLVNQLLSRFFGYDTLSLEAEKDTENVRFMIKRKSDIANHLSEGECSLISFCYFMASIQDDLESTASSSKLVIYIDDPISSLDNNHIFFVYSLIDSVIVKPEKYFQLYISTHNLDFLKYLKRLSHKKGEAAYFIIERKMRRSETNSFIRKMPTHIERYITEFNYLFNEIYSLTKEHNGDKKQCFENTYNNLYNLPNNMRKFLEYYLFYKYPNTEAPLDNLNKLFEGNIPSLLSRVINEYSHLSYIDRGWSPIDVEEIESCAKIIIEKVKEKDPDQYNALLESIK